MTTTTDRLPGYLSGVMAPVPDEIEAFDLEVTGALPTELRGRYFRNGSNPPPGVDPGHAFTGQGMVHGVRIADGRAEWYRNRWVRTPLFDRTTPPAGDRLTQSVANTSVIHHAGRIYTLVENTLPFEISPELDTVGPCDFGGRLATAMTAHPKVDPVSGDLHFFGYAARPPYLTYHRLSATGELTRSVEITVPGPTMMHDFAITEHYVIWLDLPVVFDPAAAGRRGMPYRWSDGYGARIGLMPRDGGDADVRWVEVAPGYAFHVGNAFEDADGRVVLDAVRYDDVSFDGLWVDLGGTSSIAEGLASSSVGGGVLHRWVLDPVTATVSERGLDDQRIEFPTHNDDRTGLASRYLYAVGSAVPFVPDAGATIVKYDTVADTKETHQVGHDWVSGEAVFVQAEGPTGEDHGWLISIATHRTADAARLLVVDASDVTAGPVATVTLPRRVPFGFHGNWIADDDL